MANWWDEAPVAGGREVQAPQPSASWWADAPLANALPQPDAAPSEEDRALFRSTAEKTRARLSRAGGELMLPPEQRGRPLTPERISALAREAGLSAVADTQEKRQFAEGRTPFRRTADTFSTALSMPIRILTKGQYGIGDVVGAVAPEMGREMAQGEAGFGRANASLLETASRAGQLALAIPPLAALGVPAGGVAATARAAANRPLPPSVAARIPLRNERLADVRAFENAGVEPFGPALTEAGTAGVVKQLSEAPIVGYPVRNKLLQTIEETRNAGERVAADYGQARTYRDVGNVAEQGLERFRDARSADVVEGQAAGLSNERLGEITRTPARDTSVKTKQDALYERAWRGIPEEMQRGRSRTETTRFLGGMTNTQTLLRDLMERNQRMYSATRGNEPVDAALAYPVRGGVPGQITADIIEGRWRGNLQTMRDVRSNFRRLASGIADTERNTLTLSDMRRIQSAMTEDMISLLERNVTHYTDAGQAQTATQIRRSIHDFRRADQFTRASAQRLDALEKLYNAQSAEQLGLGVFKDAMGGRKGGNLARLSSLRSSLTNEEWGDVASGVLREMGRPLGSARGAAESSGFSVGSFMTNWNNMSPEGRTMLFRRGGRPEELGHALDNFVRVADRMANFEALTNTSRSATNALGMTGLVSVLTAAQQAMTGNLGTAAAAASVGGGMYAFGKFMTSPLYVRWLTRAAELSGQPRALAAHAGRLARLGAVENDAAVQALLMSIAEGLQQR